MLKKLSVFIIFTLCVCMIPLLLSNEKEIEQAVKQVTVSEIASGKVKLIGNLGKPIGEPLEIKGKYFNGADLGSKFADGKLLLQITEINGKQLKEAILIYPKPYADFKAEHKGQSFHLSGYEHAGYEGVNFNARQKIHGQEREIAYFGYSFLTSFKILKDHSKKQ